METGNSTMINRPAPSALPVPCGLFPARRAFTLTEILVVVGVIVALLLIALPALSVWESRKEQDSINTASGVLASAQATAITEQQTVGLFFYVDPRTGEQVIWPIEQRVDLQLPNSTANRYVLREIEPYRLPKPYRVTPASVLNETLPDPLNWSDIQLRNNNHRDGTMPNPPAPGPPVGTQWHRNFFVVLFDRTGRLKSGPDYRLFIQDPDLPSDPIAGDHPGFRTHLEVKDSSLGTGDADAVIDDLGNPVEWLPVSSLLIYNDDEYQQRDRRTYLRQAGRPLYIHPITGAIIKGEPEA
ncbi:MAG: hypothetical protein HJJLKODD_01942 [Phycisphaerae bacterium]|nr:hypothetical protein [Phycisphaerae bacterium]